jgi:hypothetical protein
VSPFLSPDHKFLFFARETSTDADIYWVCVEAFLPDSNEPGTNLHQMTDPMERGK